MLETQSFTVTLTCPLTKESSADPGISICRDTDGVRLDFVISLSPATSVVDVGAIDFFPLTPVLTANPGSPIGTSVR